MSKIPKIQVTKNYRMFERSIKNRLVTPEEHEALRKSLAKYGFLPYLPIICYRDPSGKRIVKDGQNRLVLAEELGLPVYYVDVDKDQDFDVAEVARTAKAWKPRDFANMHAANGLAAYEEGLAFADTHKLTVGLAFALLAGTTNFGNITAAFMAGEFKIKDRPWANMVAATYVAMCGVSKKLKGVRFLLACMAVCRVSNFDRSRLISGAERQREKLVPYSTCEAYLQMLEDVYNFGRAQSKLIALKMEATKVMSDRNPRGKSRD